MRAAWGLIGASLGSGSAREETDIDPPQTYSLRLLRGSAEQQRGCGQQSDARLPARDRARRDRGSGGAVAAAGRCAQRGVRSEHRCWFVVTGVLRARSRARFGDEVFCRCKGRAQLTTKRGALCLRENCCCTNGCERRKTRSEKGSAARPPTAKRDAREERTATQTPNAHEARPPSPPDLLTEPPLQHLQSIAILPEGSLSAAKCATSATLSLASRPCSTDGLSKMRRTTSSRGALSS